MSQIPRLVKIAKDPLYKRVLSHSFKYYNRMATTTFCLTSITNGISIFINNKKSASFKEHPDIVTIALLTKSVYYGLLWPSFYYTAVTSPRNAFVLFSGFE